MMAVNLMTIPKEIRLCILERLVEDVTPAVLWSRDANKGSSLQLSLLPNVSEDTKANKVGLIRLTCRALHDEFYQVLAVARPLVVFDYWEELPIGDYPVGRQDGWRGEGTPVICNVLLATYTNFVRHIKLAFRRGGNNEDERLPDKVPERFLALFPALTKLSVRLNQLDQNMWYSGPITSEDQLALHASPEALRDRVRAQVEGYVGSFKWQMGDRRWLR